MNFFKSVFSDEPDSPPKPESTDPSDPTSPPKHQQPNQDSDDDDDAATSGWSFGGLMKTLTTKSESVIEIYRRDLKEFGSGLKKEIETAHGSLETVSHAIDEIGTSVIKSTSQIISQGKDVILASDDHESDSSDHINSRSNFSQSGLNSKPYSRFDAQLRLIQDDLSTYCDDPEDLDDYNQWKLGFVLEEKRGEFQSLIEQNGVIESVYKRIVPNIVDEENFWSRYCYKVFKLKQAEDMRATLVKRAISAEEEDLSWDVDDDEDDEEEPISLRKNEGLSPKDDEIVKSGEINKTRDLESEQTVDVKEDEANKEEMQDLEKSEEKDEGASKFDEKAASEEKADTGESSKDSDVSVISSHPSIQEEEDLGWDEIEDLSSIDEKKVGSTESPNKADLRKRLSAAEEDEDLSWGTEEDDDDDEPVKA
ncbi:uncharacterized protein LOC126653734 [Mercurialis annua]|uniref:uncharacterized protein LOC126653734 n=1 Tax=Mercurialis annua TaxID=3986 RepID=UPI00216087F9|nr:uncharacterized protein LOC126653734 [Mercurialis annua]